MNHEYIPGRIRRDALQLRVPAYMALMLDALWERTARNPEVTNIRCCAPLPRGSKYKIFQVSGSKNPYHLRFLGPESMNIWVLGPLGLGIPDTREDFPQNNREVRPASFSTVSDSWP